MKTIFKTKNLSLIVSQRYKKVVALLILSLTFFSCNYNLDEEVYSSFTENGFFNSVQSAELGLFGIYDGIADPNLYGRNYLIYFQQGSDHARHWRVNRGGDDDLLSNYQIQETNSMLDRVWNGLYNTINRANLVIDKVTVLRDEIANKSNPTSKEKESLAGYNNVLGDAHFLRGFLYFQLTKNWGAVPLKLSSEVNLENLKVERDPQAEVYKQIEKDMLYGISLLPNASNVRSVGRVSKTAAQGVLARVYLHWAGAPLNDTSKFPKAAEQALAVIQSGQHQLNRNINKLTIGGNTKSGSNSYLFGPDAYKDYFPEVFQNLADNVNEPKESMWEIQFSIAGAGVSASSAVGAWHGITASTKSKYRRASPRWFALPTFYKSFIEKDSLRRNWSISTFEIKTNNQFIAIPEKKLKWGVGKFRRYLMPLGVTPDRNYDSMNWPVIRYADVLLMYAEAVNETIINGGALPSGANTSNAYAAVNDVRRRAMEMNTPHSEIDLVQTGPTGFRQQIRDERSWELCFERIRKSDLIRWGILGSTLAKTSDAMDLLGYTQVGAFFQADNFEPKNTLLPIPFAAEISQNPNILNTDPTNNGYR